MKTFYRIADDGFLIKGSGKVVPENCSEDFSLLEKDSDSNLYEYYNNDGTQMVKKNEDNIQEKLNSIKWKEYYDYMNSLTINIEIDENTTHCYNAAPLSLIEIERKAKSPYLLEVKEIKWFEDWGEFMTNKIELEKVILESDKLSQNKLIEIFGV